MGKEVTRVRCPICGMMPSLDNLEKTAKEKPAEVRIFVSRFYGKAPKTEGFGVDTPYKKKGRGSAPGRIEYEDITDKVPDEVEKLRSYFDDRIKQYQEGKEK